MSMGSWLRFGARVPMAALADAAPHSGQRLHGALRAGREDDFLLGGREFPVESRALFFARRPDGPHPGLTVTRPYGTHLRLTGAVGYNSLLDHAGNHSSGWAGHLVMVDAGPARARWRALALRRPVRTTLFCARLFSRRATPLLLADRSFLRALDLYAHKAIAEADLEQAQSIRTQAQADLESSADAIRVLGVSDPETVVTRPLPLGISSAVRRWPGKSSSALCSPGQLLQAGGTQCFTLSDMSRVWVLVNIYQNDAARCACWSTRCYD